MTDPDHYLDRLTALPSAPPRMPCVVLAHNEGRIFPEFLDHYRRLGVDRFYVVDDRSTDGSTEYLRGQPDVTLFAPAEGSSYAQHKRQWRAQILDDHCAGSWVVVPDVDEHLVFAGVETRGLPDLTREMEAEGAEALHAVMLDMYRDAPLSTQVLEHGRLIDAFPLFDGPDHYFRLAAPRNFRRSYPTPFAFAVGGPRQRLFEPLDAPPGSSAARILRGSCDIGGDFSGEGLEGLRLAWARMRLKRVLKKVEIYNCSKIPLVKWRRGMWFYNGAHALSRKLQLSRRRGVLLHFKFAGGVAAMHYIADRGQHAGGAKFYKRLLDQKGQLEISPAFEGSLRYETSASLGRFLG